jgi:hypothetical protein
LLVVRDENASSPKTTALVNCDTTKKAPRSAKKRQKRQEFPMKAIVRRWCQVAFMAVFVAGCTQADRVSNEVDPSATATSEAVVAAGHSAHGEAFNEGPRQAAYLFAGNGAAHFPITRTTSEAQSCLGRGLGQVLGVWFLVFRSGTIVSPSSHQ